MNQGMTLQPVNPMSTVHAAAPRRIDQRDRPQFRDHPSAAVGSGPQGYNIFQGTSKICVKVVLSA